MSHEPSGFPVLKLPAGINPDDYNKSLAHLHEDITKRFSKPEGWKHQPTNEEMRRNITSLGDLMRGQNEEIRQAFGELFCETTVWLCAQEPLKSYFKLDYYLRLLLGDDYFNHSPTILEQFFKAVGVDKTIKDTSFDGLLDNTSRVPKETWIDTVIPTLDMLFEQRYGWNEGTAAKLTLQDLCFALENAMENDAPPRPSVWGITK
jgi:hypothetical protein